MNVSFAMPNLFKP